MKLFGLNIETGALRRQWGDLLPSWFVNPGFRSRLARPFSVDLEPGRIDRLRAATSHSDVEDILGADLRAAPKGAVDLYLPEAVFLIRRHHLPTRDQAVMRQALRLELEQKTPFKNRDVTWRVTAEPVAGGGLHVTQYIIRNTLLQHIHATAQAAGVSLRSIRLKLSDLSFANYPVSAQRMRAVWSRVGVAALIAALGFGAGGVWLTYARERGAVMALEAQVAALRDAAILARQSAEAQVAQASDRADLAAVFAQDRALLPLMAALTVAVPDSAWLVQLNISEGEMRMAGFAATSPAEFLIAIDDLPDIAGARFGGPVVRDHREQVDRFEIIAIRGDGS